ncbi:MAG TPA: fumarylacetoacetate hydrolase family protein [Candidatus Limnocylindria bacterium]|nr:fumarylacetoacetate hydrolase family protein [Candidatus Limnocylindria bacterium]
MRLATIAIDGAWSVAAIREDRCAPLASTGDTVSSMPELAAGGAPGLLRVKGLVDSMAERDWVPLSGAALGPPVLRPGAIYTIVGNYRDGPASEAPRPERPRVLGKLPSSVVRPGAVLRWDTSVTRNVDAECELGVVIGAPAFRVEDEVAMDHVFGYTIVNDLNSVDPWLDGEQWLLGKSMAGFCPLGPWIVTADALDPADLAQTCIINGQPIADGRTSQMRFSIAEVVAYISRHVRLESGDVIAMGTPGRLASPPGPDRHLAAGDVVTCRIEGIGELTNTIG